MYNENSSFLGNISPVVRNLLIINVLLFIAKLALQNKIVFGHADGLTYYLGMHYWQAEAFRPWQLITYMFMHGNISHVFFNMFALWMFGSILEQSLGTKRFLIYYMVTGIGAGIIQQAAWTIDFHSLVNQLSTIPPSEFKDGLAIGDMIFYSAAEILNQPVTVGASGSIFGLLLAFAMMFPNVPLYIMFIPIPIKAKYCIIGYAVIELFLGVANFRFDNIAHFAHLGGALFGFILLMFWRKNRREQTY